VKQTYNNVGLDIVISIHDHFNSWKRLEHHVETQLRLLPLMRLLYSTISLGRIEFLAELQTA